MKTHFKSLFAGSLLLIATIQSALAAGPWLTDIESAVAKAKEAKKPILVEFTGSDWCPPCIMMHEKVFSKQEFLDKAAEKFILVKIDIPKKDQELRAKNEKVLEKYSVSGVPTVLLMKEDGKEFHRFTATQFPEVKAFLDHITEAAASKDMD